MKTYHFSHNKPNDTTIIIDGSSIECRFRSGDSDDNPNVITWAGSVRDLFVAVHQYFFDGSDVVNYEALSIPAQDAIYNSILDICKKEACLK